MRGGNVARRTHAAERDARFQVFFYFGAEDIGHRRFDKAGSDGVDGDISRSDFDGDGFGQADKTRLAGDVVRLAGVAHLRDDRS